MLFKSQLSHKCLVLKEYLISGRLTKFPFYLRWSLFLPGSILFKNMHKLPLQLLHDLLWFLFCSIVCMYHQHTEQDTVSYPLRVNFFLNLESHNMLRLMVLLYHEEYSWDRNKKTSDFVWGRLMRLRFSTDRIHSLHLVILRFELGTKGFLWGKLKLTKYLRHKFKKSSNID